jgi:hypothetical protein
LVKFGRDFSRYPDVWYEGELAKLAELVDSLGTRWHEIGREMGRSAMQSYNTYHNSACLLTTNLAHTKPSSLNFAFKEDNSIQSSNGKLNLFETTKNILKNDLDHDEVLIQQPHASTPTSASASTSASTSA